MPSIASVYIDVLPSTAKVAAGIEKALREVDVTKIAREWKRIRPGVWSRCDSRVKRWPRQGYLGRLRVRSGTDRE